VSVFNNIIKGLVLNINPMRYTSTKYATLVNLNYLHELSENDKTFEKEMLMLYVDQFSQQLNNLEIAVNAKDYYEVDMIANNLKSSVAVLIGDRLTPHFEKIEIRASKNVIDQKSIESYKYVVDNIAKIIAELHQILLTEY
jgi:hypothetical protein